MKGSEIKMTEKVNAYKINDDEDLREFFKSVLEALQKEDCLYYVNPEQPEVKIPLSLPSPPLSERDITYLLVISNLLQKADNDEIKIANMNEVIAKLNTMKFTSGKESTKTILGEDDKDKDSDKKSEGNEDPKTDTGEKKSAHARRTEGFMGRTYGRLPIVPLYGPDARYDLDSIEPPLDPYGNPMEFVEAIHSRFETEVIQRPMFINVEVFDLKYRYVDKETGKYEYVIIKGRNPLFEKSHLTPSLGSYLLVQKYWLNMPINTISDALKYRGLNLSRQTITDWSLRLAEEKFVPLVVFMFYVLLTQGIIHVDETTVTVLDEAGKENTQKSYIFQFSSCKNCPEKIVLFQYSPDRKASTPEELLHDFVGVLVCDAYKGYAHVGNIYRAFCLLHARRNFVDALGTIPKNKRKDTKAYEFIELFNEIFKKESEFQGMTPEDRKAARERNIRPLMDKLFELCETLAPKLDDRNKKLKEAVNYLLNNRKEFTEFFNNGLIPLHNMVAERNFKRIAKFRHNSLFFGSPRGANAGMILFSIIETAIANGLNPEAYINYVLERMPDRAEALTKEFIASLMPWNEEVKKHCKMPEYNEETMKRFNELEKMNKEKNEKAAQKRMEKEGKNVMTSDQNEAPEETKPEEKIPEESEAQSTDTKETDHTVLTKEEFDKAAEEIRKSVLERKQQEQDNSLCEGNEKGADAKMSKAKKKRRQTDTLPNKQVLLSNVATVWLDNPEVIPPDNETDEFLDQEVFIMPETGKRAELEFS